VAVTVIYRTLEFGLNLSTWRSENMRKLAIAAIGIVCLLGLSGDVSHGQGGPGGSAAAQQPLPAPTDKAAYFPKADIESAWKDLEARQVINRRAMEGGAYSINIRIVREGDAPLVHAQVADVWVMMAGTAIAVTGGELVDLKKNPKTDDASGSSIKGGTEQPLQAGDILYVPPGVPHGFRNVKGFRAYLIRFETR
jgi:mannose-6-phosphate isomerase-like protein (cupin superfamily)